MLPPIMYFFPKWSRTSPPEILKAKFKDSQARSDVNAHGPNDQKGTLFTYFPNCHCQYSPERQKWSSYKYLGDDGSEQVYWIGVDTDVTPAHFERDKMLPGSPVELNHGFWTIPVANPMVESCQLPYYEVMESDGGGRWYKEYKEAYQECSQVAIELAGHYRELLLKRANNEPVALDIDDDKFRHYITTMIGVNYELSFEEMSALRLFDNETYQHLMFAFLDVEEMLQIMIKESEEANGTINPTEVPQDGNVTASGGTDLLNQD